MTFFSRGKFSRRVLHGGTLSQNSYKSLNDYTVTENHISSTVSEILRYRQPNILLLSHKNDICMRWLRNLPILEYMCVYDLSFEMEFYWKCNRRMIHCNIALLICTIFLVVYLLYDILFSRSDGLTDDSFKLSHSYKYAYSRAVFVCLLV